jgi:hypothetical protein
VRVGHGKVWFLDDAPWFIDATLYFILLLPHRSLRFEALTGKIASPGAYECITSHLKVVIVYHPSSWEHGFPQKAAQRTGAVTFHPPHVVGAFWQVSVGALLALKHQDNS